MTVVPNLRSINSLASSAYMASWNHFLRDTVSAPKYASDVLFAFDHGKKRTMLLALIACTYSISIVSCIRTPYIDNDVMHCGIQCMENKININFVTRMPFHGRLFVKGMSDKQDCVKTFSRSSVPTIEPNITIPFGACNMHRFRMVDPQPGMMQSIVIVISFHKKFITRVDRAYTIQCFYLETEKTVTSQLDVSMLSTGQLLETAKMPSCTYEVRRGGPDGSVIRFAQVGETVHHVWFCDTDSHRILVKDCFVDDGQGSQAKIINENGCSLEPVIIGDLTYDVGGPARAYVDGYVFKFADKPQVFFHCTVQLCVRDDEMCAGLTPPHCTGDSGSTTGEEDSSDDNSFGFILKQQKRKRQTSPRRKPMKRANSESSIREIDLYSAPMTVLGLEETSTNEEQQPHLEVISTVSDTDRRRIIHPPANVCFSKITYGIFLLCSVVICSSLPTILTLICWRKFSSKKEDNRR